MKLVAATTLVALAGVVTAASNPGIPTCAIKCFTSAVADTSCSLFDYYCQCTTGAKTIAKEALPCVCNDSDCTTAEILQVADASQQICSSAFAASSMTYSGTSLGNFCKAAATASSSSSGASPAKKTGTATKGAASGSSSPAAANSKNFAAPTGVGMHGAVLGMGAMAVLAL